MRKKTFPTQTSRESLPGNDQTYPTKSEVRKIIFSKMTAGSGYVIFPWSVVAYGNGFGEKICIFSWWNTWWWRSISCKNEMLQKQSFSHFPKWRLRTVDFSKKKASSNPGQPLINGMYTSTTISYVKISFIIQLIANHLFLWKEVSASRISPKKSWQIFFILLMVQKSQTTTVWMVKNPS